MMHTTVPLMANDGVDLPLHSSLHLAQLCIPDYADGFCSSDSFCWRVQICWDIMNYITILGICIYE